MTLTNPMGATEPALALPHLLLLPGLDGTGKYLDPLVPHLDAKSSVTVVSYPPDPALGYEELTDLAAASLPNGPAIVLGESYSGPIAAELAARAPDRVVGVILCSTFLRSPWPPLLIRGGALGNPALVPNWLLEAVTIGRYGNSELAAKLRTITGTLGRRLIAARLNAVSRINVEATLSKLKCPILAMHGANDRLVPSRRLAKVLAKMPNATFKLLPGPHFLLETNPIAVAREIEQFRRRLARKNT